MSHPSATLRTASVMLTILILACGGPTPPDETPHPSPTLTAPLFVDGATDSGLEVTTISGRDGRLFLHEIMGGGCALVDVDGDGDLDAFFAQGRPTGPASADLADGPRDRLFINHLEEGELRFSDATEGSGIDGREHGMGVAAGDVDNDGDVDLYVTAFGQNRLWLNHGDGTFEDATERSGVSEPRWSTSASFVDIDRDGWLDLYVTNYLDYGHHNHRPCSHPSGAPEYCGPKTYDPVPDRLFRNRGDGTFEDISASSGIGLHSGPGLGVVATDVDGDGWPDLYVANDNADNFLWLNRQGGRFAEQAVLAGCAVNWSGEREASMGLAAADIDNDGDDDLLAAHMDGETNTLYVNQGGLFDDRSTASGLGPPSRPHTAYGVLWLDVDADGLLDLFAANGAMQLFNEWAPPGSDRPLAEPDQLFRNLGDGRFTESGEGAGSAVSEWHISRAAAAGDIDNDGDTDVLVTALDSPARLLLNQATGQRPWLGLRLLTADARRDALGARIELITDDGQGRHRRAASDGSYCAASDPRVLIGLIDPAKSAIRVEWPSGSTEIFDDLPSGRYTTLTEGTGRAD